MSLVRAVDPHHRSPHSSPAKGADPLSGENGPDKHLPARAESLATRSLHPLGQQVGHHRRGRFRQHDPARAIAPLAKQHGGEPAIVAGGGDKSRSRSEEYTSELQSLQRTSYPLFCLNKK